jgi:hypothetical protein
MTYKNILWAVIIIAFLDALFGCASITSPSITPDPSQSPSTGIPPVSLAAPTIPLSATLSPQPASPPVTEQHTIEFGSRFLTNNTWGAPPDETLSSDVYLSINGNFGWRWDRMDPKVIPGNNGVQPLFPNVRIGGSPWTKSNSAYFPIQLNQVKSLTFIAAYNYPDAPTGQYNLAYDMFLTDTDLPGSSPIRKAEVMIWLHGTFTQPPSTYKGDFTDGYNTYALYSWIMPDNFLYYSFIMKGQLQLQAQHTVDAKKLLDSLNLDPIWYIPGIELGSEIVSGAGKIEISKLIINVNGNEV